MDSNISSDDKNKLISEYTLELSVIAINYGQLFSFKDLHLQERNLCIPS